MDTFKTLEMAHTPRGMQEPAGRADSDPSSPTEGTNSLSGMALCLCTQALREMCIVESEWVALTTAQVLCCLTAACLDSHGSSQLFQGLGHKLCLPHLQQSHSMHRTVLQIVN